MSNELLQRLMKENTEALQRSVEEAKETAWKDNVFSKAPQSGTAVNHDDAHSDGER